MVEVPGDALLKVLDDPEIETKLRNFGSERRALSPYVYGALLKPEDATAALMI